MSKVNNLLVGLALGTILFWASCGSKQPTPVPASTVSKQVEKTYKGHLHIVIDESLKPVMTQQVDLFTYYFDSVTVATEYLPEAEVMNKLRSKSADVAVFARILTENEKSVFKSKDTLYVRELCVAYDAIAMITAADNKFQLDSTTISRVLSGADSRYTFLFEESNSSVTKWIVTKYGNINSPVKNVYNTNGIENMLKYLQANKKSVGFIPYNLIADEDQSVGSNLLNGLKLVAMPSALDTLDDGFVTASQGDIAEGIYPLTRQINAVMQYGHKDDLPWLFLNFLYKQKAAKVFLKAGLIPALIPEREIKVNTEELKPNT